MSMKDLNEKARPEGWELAEVVDNGSTKPHVRVFGISMTNTEALAHVWAQAKARSAFHLQAIQLVVAGQPAQPRKARR